MSPPCWWQAGVTTTLNAVQVPTRIGGTAAFDKRRATAKEMLWISLAGPAASLAGGVVADIAYRRAPTSGIAHALLWAAGHDDHLHIGVGTKHALETETAAVTTMSPATARGLGRAILQLADDAERAASAQ